MGEVERKRDCERYGCRPSELDGENWHVIELHRIIEAAEQQYLRAERESKTRRG